MLDNTAQLKCGLCDFTTSDQYALDRQIILTVHWRVDHNTDMVPVFDQNTWRTGVVHPLLYMPLPTSTATVENQQAATREHWESTRHQPTTVLSEQPLAAPTIAPAQEYVEVLVREIRGASKRTKPRYQVYVRLQANTINARSFYLSTVKSLADAREQRDTLVPLLSELVGSDTVQVRDYVN